MNNIEFQCPVCGEKNQFSSEAVLKKVKEPFAKEVDFFDYLIKCNICQYETSYSSLYSDELEEVRESLIAHSIDEMIERISSRNNSYASIERALGLPQRTLSRWKQSKNVSDVGIALLRLVATFPWLVDIADENYDSDSALKIMMKEFYDTFNEFLKDNNKKATINSIQHFNGDFISKLEVRENGKTISIPEESNTLAKVM